MDTQDILLALIWLTLIAILSLIERRLKIPKIEGMSMEPIKPFPDKEVAVFKLEESLQIRKELFFNILQSIGGNIAVTRFADNFYQREKKTEMDLGELLRTDNPRRVLEGAMIWSSSSEGLHYWKDIYCKLPETWGKGEKTKWAPRC